MPAFRLDPRWYQIATLASLLGFGVWRLEFAVEPGQVAAILLTVLGAQFLGYRLTGAGRYEWKSALISGLSLCLLLRANSLWLLAAGSAAAVGSKFVLRWRGKHLFNPTVFALVLLLLCSRGCAWVSPGQWGSATFFAFLLLCLGGLVLCRARRWDVALSFLACYLALVFGRSAYLGEPLAIPLHRMQSGALLLFAFFMISDPRTTPDSRLGRMVFAGLVALGAWYVQYRLFRTNGLLWSLASCALLVPLLDRLLPGPRYLWQPLSSSPSKTHPLDHRPNYDTPHLSAHAGLPLGAGF